MLLAAREQELEFGIFHEFWSTRAASQSEAFRAVLRRDRRGRGMGPRRNLARRNSQDTDARPRHRALIVASAIAARTTRIKIGTAVQILPLGHPLRLAEETATIDQISGGRLIFGVGRSAFPRAYNAYGISYEESQDRFAESLDIISFAWTEPVCSYRGRYHGFENFTLVPRPVQRPASGNPHRRVAARYLRADRPARLSAVLGGARQARYPSSPGTRGFIATPGRRLGTRANPRPICRRPSMSPRPGSAPSPRPKPG